MKVVGIDLSGPRNIADTCLVSFAARGDEIHLLDVREGADDDQIIEAVSRLGKRDRINIGIDAPLSYNSNGGDRPSDKELHRLVLEYGGGVGIMPPTMIRMVYLTLRGMTLTRLLESLRPQYDLNIVEVHPGACMLLRGAKLEDVRHFKRDESARRNLLNWLEKMGLKGSLARKGSQTITSRLWVHGSGVWGKPFGALQPPHRIIRMILPVNNSPYTVLPRSTRRTQRKPLKSPCTLCSLW